MNRATELVPAMEAAKTRGVARFVAAAAIVANARVLVMQRLSSDPFLPGLWELPGGTLEPGEDVIDALLREINEETGLSVECQPTLLSTFDYLGPKGHRTCQFTFKVTIPTPALLIRHPEHQAYRWARVDQLVNLKCTPEARKAMLDALAM